MSKEETKRVRSRDVECGQVIRVDGVDFNVLRKDKDFDRMQMHFFIRQIGESGNDKAVRFDFTDYVDVVN
ncbi:MAG: hypothetical protein ACRC8W_04835 [Plesiomonas shigelloides]